VPPPEAEADKHIVTGDGGASDSAAEKDAMLALEDKKQPTSSSSSRGAPTHVRVVGVFVITV
jgi:hypothetical protein